MTTEDKLSASEALYGFAGWITSFNEPVTAGRSHDAAIWAELVKEYCEAHGFAEPREGWNSHLVWPEGNRT